MLGVHKIHMVKRIKYVSIGELQSTYQLYSGHNIDVEGDMTESGICP